MNKLWRNIILPLAVNQNLKLQFIKRTLTVNINRSSCYQYLAVHNSTSIFCNNHFFRLKSTKKKTYDSDDEKDSYDDDASLSKDSKIVKFNATSMRADMILKSALGVARNKVEHMFYESKIRINGRKILKKGTSARLGDEIDLVKSVSPNNPNHLLVARVEILNVTAKEDNISVTARRFKSLLIENYEEDPHKASSTSEDNK